MRVVTTPWVRGVMTLEDRRFIDEQRMTRDGATLSLLAYSAGGPFTAKLYVPELGDFRGEGSSIHAAIAAVIAQVQA